MLLIEVFKQQGKANAEFFLDINKKNIFSSFDRIDNELRKIGSFENIELKNDNDIHNLAQEIMLLQALYFNYKKTSSSIILAFLPFITNKFEFSRDLYSEITKDEVIFDFKNFDEKKINENLEMYLSDKKNKKEKAVPLKQKNVSNNNKNKHLNINLNNIQEILDMNPKSECKIYFTFTEEWEYSHYQYKNENSDWPDPNKLPLLNLDDYDIGEGGDGPLLNDNDEVVYDPSMDILENNIFEQEWIYTSKSFITLAQKKIKNLIDSGELSSESDEDEILAALEVEKNVDSIMELFDSIGCDDYKIVERKNDFDNILWFTAWEIQSEFCAFSFEEIKK